MHTGAYRFIADAVGREPVTWLRVVEIGSYNINGSVRPLCAGSATYLGVDQRPGPDVDLVCSGDALPEELTTDVVICCEVLEHTKQAQGIVAEAVRILTPGGRLLITCAGPTRQPHSGIDGGTVRDGEYYRNVETHALVSWVEQAGAVVEAIEVHPNRGDIYLQARKPE
jgi:SAM-dependent methyltransferase